MAKDERRSPGSGSLYKEDRNGRPAWTAIHKRTVNGKLVRISKKGFAKKSEAEKWLYEHKDEFERKCAIEAGEVSDAELTAEKITFGQLIDEYLKSRNFILRAPKVQKQYLMYIDYFRAKEDFCKLKVRHIDKKKCQEIVDSYGGSFDVRKKCKTVLSAVLSYAIDVDLLRKINPAHAVELPENLPGEKEIFTMTEELVITAYYIKTINPVPEKTRNGKYTSREDFMLAAAYTLILIHTGARPGEIYNVKPENVDFQKRIIKHAGIKTLRSKEGNIFFSQYIEPLVRKYLTPVNQFQRYSQGGLYDLCKRFYELINIKPHVPSAGRTTMATRLALNDTNIETMTDILRHSDSRTTYRHYVKVKGEKALQTVEEMDKGFSEYTADDNETAVILNELRRQTEGWSDEEVIAALCELLEVDRQEKEEKTSIFEFEPKGDDLEF